MPSIFSRPTSAYLPSSNLNFRKYADEMNAFLLALLALLLAAHVVELELRAVGVADRHAVHAHRAAHEVAVTQEPLVVAPLAPHRQLTRAADLDPVVLVEDVLLELLPVVVAPRDHLLHERVEIGLGQERGGRRRGKRRDPDGDGKHEQRQLRLHEQAPPRQATLSDAKTAIVVAAARWSPGPSRWSQGSSCWSPGSLDPGFTVSSACRKDQ